MTNPDDAFPAALPVDAFLAALPVDPDRPAPMVLDLTGHAPDPDVAEAAAVTATTGLPSARALWRTWRFRDKDGPIRLFIVELADGDPAAAAATVQTTVGIGSVVDAYVAGADISGGLRAARGRSALLWSAEPLAPIEVARVFDRVDPDHGPAFDPDHQMMTGADQPQRILDYLEAGHLLLATTDRLPDILDDGVGPVVPMSYRTDGTWVWTDTVAYYLRAYGLSPDGDLVAHIRARDHAVAPVSAAAAHRALAALFDR